MLAALASSPATKALDPDPFPRHSLRHAVYAALLHFGLETALDYLTNISGYREHEELVALLCAKIKEQLWLNQRMENRIDLYFPHYSYVPILQGLWRTASQRYTSKEVIEPFEVGVLADLASLDTSQISITDIISIRSEHAFDDYRRILQRILRRLQDREGKFSSLESEFSVAAREEWPNATTRLSN